MTRSPHRTALTITLLLCGAVLLGGPSLSTANGNDGTAASRLAGSRLEQLAEWSWPIAPPHAFVRAFAAPETPYSAGHRGVDLELALGGQVFAPADGVVHFSGNVASRSVLSIAHAGELLSSYEAVTSELRKGAVVREGDLIGVLSDGGHCAAQCLHFGVRLRGEYVSPMLLLGGVPRAVLLPMG